MPAVRDDKGHFVKPPATPDEQASSVREDLRRATVHAAPDVLIAAMRADGRFYHDMVLWARKTQHSRTGPLTDCLAQLTGIEDVE